PVGNPQEDTFAHVDCQQEKRSRLAARTSGSASCGPSSKLSAAVDRLEGTVSARFDAHRLKLATLSGEKCAVPEARRMTARLYYDDSFLYDFGAQVMEIIQASQGDARPAVILDRTAFYPTSGGQGFDTGW